MTLQLVVNNAAVKNGKNYITCRTNCELYDEITNECGVHEIMDPDNPAIAARCGDFIHKENHSIESSNPWESPATYDLYDEEIEEDEDVDALFLEFKGELIESTDSTYPLQPDVPSKREDAVWYKAPDNEFGCWIVNKSSNKFMAISKDSDMKEGWNERVYKSPFPLHDHGSSLPLASRMVWYVDEEGYGQYALLCAGKVSMISYPKPSSWTK